MVAEPWILKMGNQVSGSLKNSLVLDIPKKSSSAEKKLGNQEKKVIGILSFEVANVMSKIIHLHKSLADSEISKLKNEILKSDGIKNLVCDDEMRLLELALIEKLDDLHGVACVVSRLGKKCTIPALQGFEHVYGDIMSGVIDVKELGFLVKDMEGRVRKMERYVSSTANLYNELEVLNQLEIATKKFQQNQHEESRKAFEQKLIWQKQDIRHLKDVSLWNQTYDKVVELLARTVCTIYARICIVFGDPVLQSDCLSSAISGPQFGLSGNLRHMKQECGPKSGQINGDRNIPMRANSIKRTLSKSIGSHQSGLIERKSLEKKGRSHVRTQVGIHQNDTGLFGPEDFNFACGMGPGRLFMECLSLSSSKVDDDDDRMTFDRSSYISSSCSVASSWKRDQQRLSEYFGRSINGVPYSGDPRQFQSSSTNGPKFSPKSRLRVYTPPCTLGGSALALHYANVIIVIEKLLKYPHLVGEEARDDLYQMLPTSLRKSLKNKLKAYIKDLAIYDAPLAHDWKERLDQILKWLAPLAHNTIRWQSERNVEQQQQIVTKTNVLLLQTLYFADQEKTEAVIGELLVGLNYICRYEHQQNALLDCSSSFDFEDCMEWQMQLRASFQA
ncbi:OLC1v1019791C1 [Oldenlandia corymbosa var. corymbosa]|uniref:OLC1v1019791C1 n=1 Tax=Oldenlandia corymbosa var. corymbosa TaxID=529605 RepID=A0AAV1EF04_OLDCO|nr:OLC1v1019791C1 [Oldenlandia corymbosa var. corymbosa]